MRTAKIFPNGRSQAVRLPKEFHFDTDEVFIAKLGEAVVLFPREKTWEVFAESLSEFTDDFMTDRAQPAEAQRRRFA